MSEEAEGFVCLGERSCGAWLTYLACVSGPVSNQHWFSPGRCGRRKCWLPGNVGADPSHFSYCCLTSVICFISETCAPLTTHLTCLAGACHECHLPLGTPHLCSQRARVQVEGNGPKSACTVLCERQPACHGPLGSSAKEVRSLSAGSTREEINHGPVLRGQALSPSKVGNESINRVLFQSCLSV